VIVLLTCLLVAIPAANAQEAAPNKSAPEKALPRTAATATVDLSGSWGFILTSTHPDHHKVHFDVVLKQNGDKISGESMGSKFEGTVSGSEVVFKPLPFLGDAVGKGKIMSPDRIAGTIDVPEGYNPAWTWEFTRNTAH